jgi:lysozyme
VQYIAPSRALEFPVPRAAVDMAAESEGLRMKAYRCPAGVWTIGRGRTRGVAPGMECSLEQADAWFLEECHERVKQIEAVCTEAPTPNQLGGMWSLHYNIGDAAFANSTVLKAHNRGDFVAAARAFSLWDKARVGGVLTALPGLTARRAAEAALYLAPEPDAPHAPLPQAVAAESSIAASPIAKGGAVTIGAGVLSGLSEAAGSLGGLSGPFSGAKDLLVNTLGVPPSWILPMVLIGAGGLIVRWRLKQRADGWA